MVKSLRKLWWFLYFSFILVFSLWPYAFNDHPPLELNIAYPITHIGFDFGETIVWLFLSSLFFLETKEFLKILVTLVAHSLKTRVIRPGIDIFLDLIFIIMGDSLVVLIVLSLLNNGHWWVLEHLRHVIMLILFMLDDLNLSLIFELLLYWDPFAQIDLLVITTLK
jgi:hypothetical protein